MEQDKQELLKADIEYLKNLEKNIQLGRFRIDSTSEWNFSLHTDNKTGIVFQANGNSLFFTNGTSTEVVGRGIKDKGVPGKMIRAAGGDIVLDAVNGNIVLRGKNVTVVATDALGGQVVIDSSKMVSISAPNVKSNSDYCSITGSSNVDVVGATVSNHAEISNENTTSTDEDRGSFFSKILSAIKRFKKFFESPCG